jgi:23S rRNA pseudouridine1911/1915/1917 synthase
VLRVPAGAIVRADRFLASRLRGWSRRRVQGLLDSGAIRIGGRRLRKGDSLPPGTELVVEIAEEGDLPPEPDPPVAVLHEDERILALDKPAGRPGHSLRPRDRGTIANFLAARFPETRQASPRPLEHGLVHRLDTDTSGVLLVARDREAWEVLRRQFRERSVGKQYVALVTGVVTAPGEISWPITPDPADRRRVRVVLQGSPPRGARPALTRYRPIAAFERLTLLEIEIPTGVMHQIRAHLAAFGHPVVGDALYGSGPGRARRQLLHATSITFSHPAAGRRMRIESPLPTDFTLPGREAVSP